MLRWKKDSTGDLVAYDKWTNTYYRICVTPNVKQVELRIRCVSCCEKGEDITYEKSFASVGSAKGWVTRNFG